jgi:hypothetical protein
MICGCSSNCVIGETPYLKKKRDWRDVTNSEPSNLRFAGFCIYRRPRKNYRRISFCRIPNLLGPLTLSATSVCCLSFLILVFLLLLSLGFRHSYPSIRCHITRVADPYSSPGFPSAGVPEGSVIGSTLFSVLSTISLLWFLLTPLYSLQMTLPTLSSVTVLNFLHYIIFDLIAWTLPTCSSREMTSRSTCERPSQCWFILYSGKIIDGSLPQ